MQAAHFPRRMLLFLFLCDAPLMAEEPPGPPPLKRTVSTEPRAATVQVPAIEDGKSTRQAAATDSQTKCKYEMRLDLSGQVLRFSVPEESDYREDVARLEAGDTMIVTADSAVLMVGSEAVARVRKNRVLLVTRRNGPWIGTRLFADGKQTSGWILDRHVKRYAVEPEIRATPAGADSREFASLGILTQKTKLFDDGLYAAVELAAQKGAGEFAGKRRMLARLAAALGREVQFGRAEEIVTAGARLGGAKIELPLAFDSAADARAAAILRDPLRSKPLAFYTWSPELANIYRQDRMLQTPLFDQDAAPEKRSVDLLLSALHADAKARATYEAYLNLTSKLTNPPAHPDLRAQLALLDDERSAAPPLDVHFFPPSVSREAELVNRLFARTPPPPGFNLADEMIARIRDGRLDLAPTETSGWYDHQTWALESLVVPDKMPEAAQFELNDGYRDHLTELFKGIYALTRETHVKQASIPPAAEEELDSPAVPKLALAPEISGEPLPTYLLRRAESYRFVHQVLEETFGAEALTELHRQTPDGPVAAKLADELSDIESLCYGGYVTVGRQLGMTPDLDAELGSGDADADTQAYLNWAANLHLDGDVGRDVRMMVPIFYDPQQKKTKVWAFLGWQSKRLFVSFAKLPGVRVFDAEGAELPEDGYELVPRTVANVVATPVVVEVYVNHLLDRDEFRNLLDTCRTKAVMVQTLRMIQ